jgi:hypothetical protein
MIFGEAFKAIQSYCPGHTRFFRMRQTGFQIVQKASICDKNLPSSSNALLWQQAFGNELGEQVYVKTSYKLQKPLES